MKIALIILHADPKRGGAERYTFDLAAALVQRGHEVHVVASSFTRGPKRFKSLLLPAIGVTRAQKYMSFLDAVEAQLGRNQFDIVHAMLPVRSCDVYHPHAGIAATVQKSSAIKRIFNPRRVRFSTVERALLESARPPAVLCLSRYVKEEVKRYYPALPEEQLPILFNAVDLHRFDPPAMRPPRDYINGLFIGQDFERKGLRQVLVAASMLKEPKLKITVVGRRQASFRPPPDAAGQVSFAGETPDPRPFYRDADFFVLPTKHDPCSLVVLEALAMGVPVISTKFNGATEIMTDGVHGYVLDDPDDVDALAAAMRKMSDPTRQSQMSQACLALRPQLSYEHHLNQLIANYERCIQARS